MFIESLIMISVKEAKSLIQDNIIPLPIHKVSLSIAAGHTLAEDIYAELDIPAFEQSSMDGYAIRFSDIGHPLIINGEMQAGTDKEASLLPFQAMRIFTGAPLPNDADTVVMQEKVEVNNGILTILDLDLLQGSNVRKKGAEVKNNALAIVKGSRLTPGAVGFLAGIGITDVKVYRTPVVGIIVTGKELQQPGKTLAFGQVYESNSYALTAALELAQVTQINFYTADDDLTVLTAVLKEALECNDMVLLTGGVSVGDYDFVIRATEQLAITQIFHKVKQKPGKPLYFGKKQDKVIFGLPGNPSSVLSCFYHYVLPALEAMMNYKGVSAEKSNNASRLKIFEAILTHNFTKTAGLTHFLKAYFTDGKVTPLHAQESFRMSSFAEANCMIEMEEDKTDFVAGSLVKVYLFPE